MSRGRRVPVGSRRCDHGSATVEAAVLAPGLLLLIGLIIVAGRVSLAGGTVEDAAAAAARQASLARTAGQARQAALDTAKATLAADHIVCTRTTVTVDTVAFTVPIGQPARVRVVVTCQVRLSDLGLPVLPGTRRLEAIGISPLDPYRERSP